MKHTEKTVVFFQGIGMSAPELPAHHNCRCLYLPEIKGMEGFDDDDERASVDGPVSANTTYEDWLKSQPDNVIRDILGPTRYSLYKEGMTISSFVTDGRTLTLRQLIDNEGLELFGGGLKEKSPQAQKAYADTYYESIRNRADPTDIEKITKHTGFSFNEITSIRNHLFINKHDLGEGDYNYFETDWRIAQAWQRMEQGWKDNGMEAYRDIDILLLKHEIEELTIMAKFGYNALDAHRIVDVKFPWNATITDFMRNMK